ncbi:MAG: 30S ribosomal protein S27ae [Nanoarchaeota archaeon]|nr:30S ribosomal protein S27ae [Nanoarchaeota archaeon]
MPKKKKPKKKGSKKYAKYRIESGKLIKPKFCPRCGEGVILAISKDRIHCGKCHYTEFSSKSEAKAEEVKESKEVKSEKKK